MSQTVLCVFDTETSGLEEHDDICQLSAIVAVEGDEEDVMIFDEYCNPGVPISERSSEIHGITDAMVADKPWAGRVVAEFWNDVMLVCQEYYDIDPDVQLVLAGHNVGFDLRKCGKHLPAGTLTRHGKIDTLLLARRLFPHHENHTLEHTYTTLGLNSGRAVRAHDALSDVWMCYDIIQVAKTTLGYDYSKMWTWCASPVEVTHMPFGQHKGKPLSEVNTGYMEYLLRQGGLDLDVEHSLRRELDTREPELLDEMPFGKHKGVAMGDLPESYVRWMSENMDLGIDMRYTLQQYFPQLFA